MHASSGIQTHEPSVHPLDECMKLCITNAYKRGFVKYTYVLLGMKIYCREKYAVTCVWYQWRVRIYLFKMNFQAGFTIYLKRGCLLKSRLGHLIQSMNEWVFAETILYIYGLFFKV
jgi:hypothetical protein